MTPMLAINIAVTSVVARRRGENNPESAQRCLRQSIILNLFITLVLSLTAYVLKEEILRLVGAKSDTIRMASDYMSVILVGLPFLAVSLTICAAQRGAGQTKISMRVNMAANLVNVVFNYFLIGGNWIFPRMEAKGAALATVIGWAVGLVMAVVSVLRRDDFLSVVSREGWIFDRQTLSALYKVTSGSVVEMFCMRIGMILTAVMVANLGTVMLAANTIGMNMIVLSFSLGEGLSIAASALVGQNLGAKRPDLSLLYGKICQRLGVLFCVGIFLLFTFMAGQLYGLFTSDPVIIEIGKSIMIIASIITFGQASQYIYLGILRGAGDTKFTAMVSVISIMTVRPFITWLLIYALGIGLTGGWIAILIDQYLRFAMTYMRFLSGKWADVKL
jgi:putative MATE family efflux protein